MGFLKHEIGIIKLNWEIYLTNQIWLNLYWNINYNFNTVIFLLENRDLTDMIIIAYWYHLIMHGKCQAMAIL